ncbi:MAG: hypothetical protein HKN80_13175 [Acidimicrobiia bacterium]|nr:hypothetical protein [Acidimicrobiia bacterium]
MTIERSDLESKFRQIQSAVDETTATAKNAGIGLAIGGVLLALLVYFLGRSKGKKGGAQLEIYRLS